MSSLPPLPKLYISLEHYQEFEATSEWKYEWYNGMMWPVGNPDNLPQLMAGANLSHVRIITNIAARVDAQLADGPCEIAANDLKIRVEESEFRAYPDAVIFCEEARFEQERGLDVLLDPLAIFEILSPSTAAYDRGAKWEHYQLIPSLRHYVLVAPDRLRIEHLARQDDGSWVLRTSTRREERVEFADLGIFLALEEIYRRVELENQSSLAPLSPQT